MSLSTNSVREKGSFEEKDAVPVVDIQEADVAAQLTAGKAIVIDPATAARIR